MAAGLPGALTQMEHPLTLARWGTDDADGAPTDPERWETDNADGALIDPGAMGY